jgi:hypothetical protein
MRFEPSRIPDVFGALLAEKAMAEQPVFGPDRVDIVAAIEDALVLARNGGLVVEDQVATQDPLPEAFYKADAVATKLRLLREFVHSQNGTKDPEKNGAMAGLENESTKLSLASDGVGSCSEMHESVLQSLVASNGLPREAQCVVDHSMLLRAKEKYLLDPVINRDVVQDDPWVRFVWDWITGQ